MGARAYRVIFAAISLPLATLAVAHFINHRCAARESSLHAWLPQTAFPMCCLSSAARYDGLPLWNVRGQPVVHELVWVLNFVSFFFLYPSTFNLLEVWPVLLQLAAVLCVPFTLPALDLRMNSNC